MKNKGNCINNFELGAVISIFLVIGSKEKKNSSRLISVVYATLD